MVSETVKQEIKRLFVEEGKTAQEIAEMYQFTPSKVRNILRRTEGAKRYSKAPLRVGEVFGDGNLEIVGVGSPKKEKKTGTDRQTYDVKCKLCDSITNILRQNLVKNSRRCCQGCMKAGRNSRLWKGYNDLSLTFFHDIRNGAIDRNLEFNLTIEELWDLYEKQNRKCALSDLDIDFDVNTPDWKGRKPTASLDRINPKIGYNIDNIQWVHYDINIMKQDFTQEEFLDWCNKVYDFSNGNTIYFNPIELEERQHHKNWQGYGNISKYLYNSYKKGAESRKHSFEISIEYLWNLFIQQKGLCALTGVPIVFAEKFRDYSIKTASPDRIDSSKGYIEGNIQWVHKDINFIKHKLDQDKFKELCKLVTIKGSLCVY